MALICDVTVCVWNRDDHTGFNRAFSAGAFLWLPLNPGALPQAGIQLRAFGANTYKRTYVYLSPTRMLTFPHAPDLFTAVNCSCIPRSAGGLCYWLSIRKIGDSGHSDFRVALRVSGPEERYRWPVKIDPSPVPSDKSTIQAVTPSQICEWKGPAPKKPLTPETDTRIAAEQKWITSLAASLA